MSDKSVDCILDKREHYKPNNWVSRTLQQEFEKRYAENFVPVTAWIYRKKVLEEVKGFDKNLEYAEDADIGIRLRKAGYDIVFAPKAVQYHLGEPGTLEEVIKRSWKYGQNMKKFYAKNGSAPTLKNILFICSIIFPPLLLLIFITNMIRYDTLSPEQRIKLSFISIIRNAAFAVSYTLSILDF